MSDVKEIYDALKIDGQKKREFNRKNSPKVLKKNKIEYEDMNKGAHLLVARQVDFWPGTGLWICRDTKRRGRGVEKLVEFMKRA